MIPHSWIWNRLANKKLDWQNARPFPYVVIDSFLPYNSAAALADEFPPYEDKRWCVYNNAIENKKALNDWHAFPPETYQFFTYMCSETAVSALSTLAGVRLYPDYGLHGGGWHIHGDGGNLNPHLDYSVHPKLDLQRKLNVILYLTKDYHESWGGRFGLWGRGDNCSAPGAIERVIFPYFNRAVIFDTSQQSWHGLSEPLRLPDNIYRKSLAMYYLTDRPPNADLRNRALFAPREEQQDDEEVLQLCVARSKIR